MGVDVCGVDLVESSSTLYCGFAQRGYAALAYFKEKA